jgi:CRP/FNR family transcriptional regulator, cyclic AMP receptor protein
MHSIDYRINGASVMTATLTTSLTFDADMLDELARHGDTRHWEAGSTVVTEGDPAGSMYLVLEGELRAGVSGEGGRSVELDTLRPDEVFGGLLLHAAVRSATVQAVTRCA